MELQEVVIKKKANPREKLIQELLNCISNRNIKDKIKTLPFSEQRLNLVDCSLKDLEEEGFDAETARVTILTLHALLKSAMKKIGLREKLYPTNDLAKFDMEFRLQQEFAKNKKIGYRDEQGLMWKEEPVAHNKKFKAPPPNRYKNVVGKKNEIDEDIDI